MGPQNRSKSTANECAPITSLPEFEDLKQLYNYVVQELLNIKALQEAYADVRMLEKRRKSLMKKYKMTETQIS